MKIERYVILPDYGSDYEAAVSGHPDKTLKNDDFVIHEWCLSKDVIKLERWFANLLRRNLELCECLKKLAAQTSGIPGSTQKSDCMAALARAVLNNGSYKIKEKENATEG